MASRVVASAPLLSGRHFFEVVAESADALLKDDVIGVASAAGARAATAPGAPLTDAMQVEKVSADIAGRFGSTTTPRASSGPVRLGLLLDLDRCTVQSFADGAARASAPLTLRRPLYAYVGTRSAAAPPSRSAATRTRRGSSATAGPPAFVVSGAGCPQANGRYARDGEYEGAPKYAHEDGQLWLLRYTVRNGQQWWYIADKDRLDVDDGDLYRVKSDGDAPPTAAPWQLAKDGVTPPPTLRAERATGPVGAPRGRGVGRRHPGAAAAASPPPPPPPRWPPPAPPATASRPPSARRRARAASLAACAATCAGWRAAGVGCCRRASRSGHTRRAACSRRRRGCSRARRPST